MSPTILVHDGGRVVALGSPGSNRIPSILAGVISNMVDRGRSLREAIEAPRVLWGGRKEVNIEVEIAGPITEDYVRAFNEMGYTHPVEPGYFPADPSELVNFGGVNAVAFDPESVTFIGMVDPRRGGLAEGPRAVAGSD
jgi:gamma-glutamyltranspeptidase/glutathione hydrolase